MSTPYDPVDLSNFLELMTDTLIPNDPEIAGELCGQIYDLVSDLAP